MILIRILVLHCLVYNVKLKALYLKSSENVAADYLSRGKLRLQKTQNYMGRETYPGTQYSVASRKFMGN